MTYDLLSRSTNVILITVLKINKLLLSRFHMSFLIQWALPPFSTNACIYIYINMKITEQKLKIKAFLNFLLFLMLGRPE